MLLFEVAEFSTAGMSFFCSPLRQGSCPGLAATANHLARESHMDDLARDATMDSLDFRLKNVLGYKTARCGFRLRRSYSDGLERKSSKSTVLVWEEESRRAAT
jgi:CO/xanthine dehydrogenase Mo-binding subunit